MAQAKRSTQTHFNDPLGKRMIIGAGIGVLVISFFLVPSEAKPEWGQFWMVRPLIVTPLAGALGGFCNYVILNFYELVGLNRVVARILSVIVPLVGLFMGVVLGLDGTLWD